MKHAKSKDDGKGVGVSGISNNPSAIHQQRQFLAKTLAIAQLEKADNGNEHCDPIRDTAILNEC